QPKHAAVIGGGFIGLEMAENLAERGIQVSLIEAQNQVMAPIDFEMAQLLHENMDSNGVKLYLGDGVQSFSRMPEGKTKISLSSGKEVQVDMVILSIGVRPNSELAKGAGLALNGKGGIQVNDYLETSAPDIYAVGDVIEIENFVTKEPGMIPLAGPANKQGRIVANNISGRKERYEGTLGTSVAKVFDLTVAAVGLNEKTLKSMGKKKDEDYYVALINQKSHAGYYPQATPLTLKMIFEKGGKILGAQIVGQEGVDKRIDTIATTMRLNGTTMDLAKLELAYAPPYSSAKDPVNMLGFVAENILTGMVSFVQWEALQEDDFILDITEEVERMVFAVPGSYHIPLGQLRQRVNELPRDKRIVLYCAIGVRSYNGARILSGLGFSNVAVAAGGTAFYKSYYYKPEERKGEEENILEEKNINEQEIKILDCCGLQCPGPIMKVNEALKNMLPGETMRVSATDMGFAKDVESWCKRMG
ncbi:MAG: FAD-dependent oxidoreductase, partial [Anaerovoracaceae bacterium]